MAQQPQGPCAAERPRGLSRGERPASVWMPPLAASPLG